MSRFDQKVVVVTGAGGGIGRASVMRFIEEGASVCAVDLDEAGLSETARLAAEAGTEILTITADVSSAGEVEAIHSPP